MYSSALPGVGCHAFILQRLHRKNQCESVLESPDMQPRHRVHGQLYLASNSPRRRELLSITGLDYSLLPAQVDETPLAGEQGAAYVRRVADCKAMAALPQAGLHGVIIAADTAVVDGSGDRKAGILGKPADREEASAMLRGLRGHTHRVFTAITILPSKDDTLRSDLCVTDVPMRDYSDEEIATYVASGDPLDKAGAYAIQHAGFHPVDQLYGCYANVMGLPLCHLLRNLLPLNIKPPVDVPKACQSAIGYDCPLYRVILKGVI
jgi:septum formation protein